MQAELPTIENDTLRLLLEVLQEGFIGLLEGFLLGLFYFGILIFI